MKVIYRILMVLICTTMISACAPATFIQTSHANWNTIELSDSLVYDDAWKIAVDTVGQKFDIEVLNKEAGYLRTGWDYKWTGELNEKYRVRALIKFAPNMRSFQVRSEAEYRTGSGWVMGEDERLTQVMKTDLMGKLGRVAK